MKKYLRVFIEILKNNLIREMEFRANFFLWLGVQGLWIGLQILIVQILFQYTDAIHGWTKPEIFLLIGIFRLIRGIFDFFVYANLVGFPESVGRGELDYTLTKPINTLFFVSVRKHQYSQLGRFISGVGFILYAWGALSIPVNLENILSLTFFMVAGFLTLYSIILLISTASIFLIRLSALSSFYDILNTALRYPVNLLVNDNQLQFLLIPFATIVTIPAQVVLGKPLFGGLLSELSVMVLVGLALWFWNFALKHYSSASS